MTTKTEEAAAAVADPTTKRPGAAQGRSNGTRKTNGNGSLNGKDAVPPSASDFVQNRSNALTESPDSQPRNGNGPMVAPMMGLVPPPATSAAALNYRTLRCVDCNRHIPMKRVNALNSDNGKKPARIARLPKRCVDCQSKHEEKYPGPFTDSYR